MGWWALSRKWWFGGGGGGHHQTDGSFAAGRAPGQGRPQTTQGRVGPTRPHLVVVVVVVVDLSYLKNKYDCHTL